MNDETRPSDENIDDSAATAGDDIEGQDSTSADGQSVGGDRSRTHTGDRSHAQRAFVRDAAVFHGKLALDGLRDLLLFPATLIAAVVDLIRRDDTPGRYFYDVVHFGKQTETWIDLFEVVNRVPDIGRPRPTIQAPSVDELIDDLEARLRETHQEGDISATARRAIDQIREAARKAMGATAP